MPSTFSRESQLFVSTGQPGKTPHKWHMHSKKCWVKNNPSWVKNGQTQQLGCFNPVVGLNVCPT